MNDFTYSVTITTADYSLAMSRCTAPVKGHRTAGGRAACPVCSGRGYGNYSPPRPSYPPSGYTPRSGGGGGSVGGRTRPRWSPSSSAVTYTPDQVRALTPYRRTVELRGQQPELRTSSSAMRGTTGAVLLRSFATCSKPKACRSGSARRTSFSANRSCERSTGAWRSRGPASSSLPLRC